MSKFLILPSRQITPISSVDHLIEASLLTNLRSAVRRKEFELLRHLAANAFPWAAQDVPGVLSRPEKGEGKRAGGMKKRHNAEVTEDVFS